MEKLEEELSLEPGSIIFTPDQKPRRACLIKIDLRMLGRALGLPPDIRIEQIVFEPEDWFNQTRLLVVSGDNEALPIVQEGERLHRAILSVSESVYPPWPRMEKLEIID